MIYSQLKVTSLKKKNIRKICGKTPTAELITLKEYYLNVVSRLSRYEKPHTYASKLLTESALEV